MNLKSFAAGVVLVLVVGGIGAAYATGYGPAPGDPGGGEVGDFPTETTTVGTTDGSGSASETTTDGSGSDSETTTDDGSTTAAAPEFGVTIDSVETCGQTCRDVTTTLANTGEGDATNVTVYSRVFVGQGTDGDVVWSGEEDVGTLAAGNEYTTTRRVSLTYSEGYQIKQADGWITIQTTIVSDETTVTFTEQRQVA